MPKPPRKHPLDPRRTTTNARRSTIPTPPDHRLAHALRYAAIRRLEMDMGMVRGSLSINGFQKHALDMGELKTQGVGEVKDNPPSVPTVSKEFDRTIQRASGETVEKVDNETH